MSNSAFYNNQATAIAGKLRLADARATTAHESDAVAAAAAANAGEFATAGAYMGGAVRGPARTNAGPGFDDDVQADLGNLARDSHAMALEQARGLMHMALKSSVFGGTV